MELAKRTGNLSMGGDIASSSNFKIAMNAKMFDVLSNSMYEDKIGSIIREISANALDGHTKAGCPEKPFTIHVPNAIEPWFSVKDEGVGMSDEDIQHVYSTYGESTKDQSNDEIGAFGLGSKTPFAYTDQFTVISINGGVKRTYAAVRGDDGLPSINLLDEQETDEPSGVEVSMVVNKDDINEFRKKIITQLKFFAVKPTLVNNLDGLEFPDLDQGITYQSDIVTVYSGQSSSWRDAVKDPVQDLWVVQGGVGYRLNLELLGDMPVTVKSFAEALYGQNAYITFPIGDIAVTANREGISYEPHTVDSIIKRLSEIAAEMTAEVVKTLEGQKSVWDRITTYNDQMDVMQRAIKNLDNFDKLFEGAELSRGRMVLKINPLNDAGYNAVWMAKYEYSPRNSYSYVTKVKRKVVGEASGRYSDTVTLEPVDGMRVFIRDTGSRPMARIQMLCDDQDYPAILMIESKMRADITDKEIKKIAKLLSLDKSQIEKLSDLPAPKVTKSGKPADKRPRAFQWDTSTRTDNSRDWTALFDDIDDIEDAIYVPMDRHSIVTLVDGTNEYRKFNLLMQAKQNGLVDKPIIAVNAQTRDRIMDGKIGAQHQFWAEAADALIAELAAKKLDYMAHQKYHSFQYAIGRNSIFHKVWEVDNSTVALLNKMKAVDTRMNTLAERIGDGAMRLFSNFWEEITGDDQEILWAFTGAGEEAGKARTAALMETYPMIKHVGHYPDDETIKEVINYMKMVDGA